jgi:signal transduction histidine kinase
MGKKGAVMDFVPSFTDEEAVAEVVPQEDKSVPVTPAALIERVAPEVRLPLASVVGSLELLRNGSLGTLLPYQEKILGVASRNTQQLVSMLEDMFTLSQMEADRFRLITEQVSLQDIVEGAILNAKSMYDDKTIVWKFEAMVERSPLQADPQYLQRALANLISNAAKFADKKGEVRVTLRREFGGHVVTIEDNGIGIPDGELEELGDYYFHSSSSRAGSFHGAGIGFVVAQKIVALHEGEIFVNSTDLGTLVVVQLPYGDDENSFD